MVGGFLPLASACHAVLGASAAALERVNPLPSTPLPSTASDAPLHIVCSADALATSDVVPSAAVASPGSAREATCATSTKGMPGTAAGAPSVHMAVRLHADVCALWRRAHGLFYLVTATAHVSSGQGTGTWSNLTISDLALDSQPCSRTLSACLRPSVCMELERLADGADTLLDGVPAPGCAARVGAATRAAELGRSDLLHRAHASPTASLRALFTPRPSRARCAEGGADVIDLESSSDEDTPRAAAHARGAHTHTPTSDDPLTSHALRITVRCMTPPPRTPVAPVPAWARGSGSKYADMAASSDSFLPSLQAAPDAGSTHGGGAASNGLTPKDAAWSGRASGGAASAAAALGAGWGTVAGTQASASPAMMQVFRRVHFTPLHTNRCHPLFADRQALTLFEAAHMFRAQVDGTAVFLLASSAALPTPRSGALTPASPFASVPEANSGSRRGSGASAAAGGCSNVGHALWRSW
ncbi:MAG: hypothetical protein EOO41_00475 [Methanobacteriota archaeon]|nr:MAG: hypothetical protein EOO41_00475 [Euryarchaeota archaeon]